MKQLSFWIILVTILPLIGSCTNNKAKNSIPKIHFSGNSGWTGEPTAFVYYQGEYHLFYQYNPTDVVFGNISWGHAVSNDLLHWQELPIAIKENGNGQNYSGSVIIDEKNTSGLGTINDPAFIAYYTQYKSADVEKGISSSYSIKIAYSNDKGHTWTDNIQPEWQTTDTESNSLRNPNVSWNQQLNKWVMTVSTGQSIKFFTSTNTKQWTFLCEFGEKIKSIGGWETSSLFPMQVESSNKTKWILIVNMNGSPSDEAPGIRYFVGDFNEKGFTLTQDKDQWLDYGKDNYAGIICNNLPETNLTMIGWMNSWYYAHFTPAEGKKGSMTFPRQLKLTEKNGHYFVSTSFHENLYNNKTTWSLGKTEISDTKDIDKPSTFSTPFLLEIVFDTSNKHALSAAREYGIRFKTSSGKVLTIAYQAEMGYYYIDRSGFQEKIFSNDYEKQLGAVYRLYDSSDKWNILSDNGSIEFIAGNGLVSISSLVINNEEFEIMEVFAKSGKKNILEANLRKINRNIK